MAREQKSRGDVKTAHSFLILLGVVISAYILSCSNVSVRDNSNVDLVRFHDIGDIDRYSLRQICDEEMDVVYVLITSGLSVRVDSLGKPIRCSELMKRTNR